MSHSITSENKVRAQELHQRILSSGQLIAAVLVEFCRELKEMRDFELYKELGYESFDTYVETAVGLKKRQAYNYITTYESWGPRLLAQNAGIGITKLEILSHLPATDREDVAADNDIDGMSVKEVRELVDRLNNYGEQISLLQDNAASADAQAEQLSAEIEALRTQKAALEKTVSGMDARLEDVKKAPIDLAQTAAIDLESVKAQAAAEATAAMEKDYRQKLKAEKDKLKEVQEDTKRRVALAEDEKAQALARAQTLEKQLQLSASEESTAFALHFDLLQQSVEKMKGLARELAEKGQAEQAQKLSGALKNALMSIAEGVTV